ncbi:MAG TPA: hypothetical protein VHT96_14520 [Clostridia bacterium]|nr:hypothetical protein [Clostridia bacterium]
MLAVIESQLKVKYPPDIVDALLRSYLELKENFSLGKFKPTELEGGFFVECVRRIIEIELFGTIIPIGTTLNTFSDAEMKRYENATGDESYRLHLPRALRSVYNMRNKRGVGHLSHVFPNVMDSTYIVSTCDWVLAELIRLISTLAPDECQRIIDSIVQRKLPIIFEDGDIQRVLDHTMKKSDQTIVLLYHNSQPIKDDTLCRWVEYASLSMYKRRVLEPSHTARLIEYRNDGFCLITPNGIDYVERLINK